MKMQVVQSRIAFLHLPALSERLVFGLQLVGFGSMFEANFRKVFNSCAWTALLETEGDVDVLNRIRVIMTLSDDDW